LSNTFFRVQQYVESYRSYRFFTNVKAIGMWWLYAIEMTTVVAIFQYVAQRTDSQLLIAVSYINYGVFLLFLASEAFRFAIHAGTYLTELDAPPNIPMQRKAGFFALGWLLFVGVLSLFYVLPFVVVPAINEFAAAQN